MDTIKIIKRIISKKTKIPQKFITGLCIFTDDISGNVVARIDLKSIEINIEREEYMKFIKGNSNE